MQLAVRDAIIAQLNANYVAAYPTIPVVFDNGPFDWNDPPDNFVEIDIEFLAGHQIGAAWVPKTRVNGCVYIAAYSRVGTGTRIALGVIDWFSQALEYKTFSRIHMQAADPQGKTNGKGWYIEQLKVAFYADPP